LQLQQLHPTIFRPASEKDKITKKPLKKHAAENSEVPQSCHVSRNKLKMDISQCVHHFLGWGSEVSMPNDRQVSLPAKPPSLQAAWQFQ